MNSDLNSILCDLLNSCKDKEMACKVINRNKNSLLEELENFNDNIDKYLKMIL